MKEKIMKIDKTLEGHRTVDASKLAHYEDLEEQGRLVVLAEGLDKRKMFADLSDKWCPHCFGMDDYMDTDKKKCEKELYCKECWEKALKGE